MRNEIKLGNFSPGTPGTIVFFKGGTGVAEELIVGTNLSITGNTLNATGGGSGGAITSINVTGGSTGLTTSGGPVTTGIGVIILAGTLGPNNGGTGIPGDFVIGDLIVANASNSLHRVAAPALGNVYRSVAVGTEAQWGKVELTGAGKSVNGVLDFANGGLQFGTINAGEIVYAPSNNTMGKIALGSNGQVLTIVTGLPVWAAPSGGGSGTVTSVSSSNFSPLFTVGVGTPTLTPAFSFTAINQAANLIFASPSSGAAAAPTFRTMVLADLPLTPTEDITATTYTFVSADNKKIKRFTNVAGCVATLPVGLPTGWETIAYRGAGAGIVSFLSAGTYEGAGSALNVEKTMAYLYHRGSNIHVASGALTGGITNSSILNELPKTDASGNLISTGLFSTSAGTIDVNNTTLSLKANAIVMGQGTGGSNGGPYIAIAQRTANPPLTSGANVVIYGQDSVDNTVALSLYTEQVVEAIGTFTASHKYKVQINGIFYWINLDLV